MNHQVTRLPISRPVALVPGCARLWKAVNSCRYQGPGVWSAGVAKELGPSELDLLEGHACDAGGCSLWARTLGLSDGFIVHLHRCGGDGVDLP